MALYYLHTDPFNDGSQVEFYPFNGNFNNLHNTNPFVPDATCIYEWKNSSDGIGQAFHIHRDPDFGKYTTALDQESITGDVPMSISLQFFGNAITNYRELGVNVAYGLVDARYSVEMFITSNVTTAANPKFSLAVHSRAETHYGVEQAKNTWHQLVYTYDGADTANIYLNGVHQGSLIIQMKFLNNPFQMASNSGIYNLTYDGHTGVRQYRIFNKVLNSTEIAQLRTLTTAPPPPPDITVIIPSAIHIDITLLQIATSIVHLADVIPITTTANDGDVYTRNFVYPTSIFLPLNVNPPNFKLGLIVSAEPLDLTIYYYDRDVLVEQLTPLELSINNPFGSTLVLATTSNLFGVTYATTIGSNVASINPFEGLTIELLEPNVIPHLAEVLTVPQLTVTALDAVWIGSVVVNPQPPQLTSSVLLWSYVGGLSSEGGGVVLDNIAKPPSILMRTWVNYLDMFNDSHALPLIADLNIVILDPMVAETALGNQPTMTVEILSAIAVTNLTSTQPKRVQSLGGVVFDYPLLWSEDKYRMGFMSASQLAVDGSSVISALQLGKWSRGYEIYSDNAIIVSTTVVEQLIALVGESEQLIVFTDGSHHIVKFDLTVQALLRNEITCDWNYLTIKVIF